MFLKRKKRIINLKDILIRTRKIYLVSDKFFEYNGFLKIFIHLKQRCNIPYIMYRI